MGEVVSIESAKPHVGGEAKCLSCGHEWYAVAPTGDHYSLECPECGLNKGELKGNFGPSAGDVVFECNCGHDTYFAYPDGLQCIMCGTKHKWDDVL